MLNKKFLSATFIALAITFSSRAIKANVAAAVAYYKKNK